MKIGNNPQHQLYENTKEIEKLKNAIKEAYRTNDDVVLNTASISVAKSLTNAGADVKDGWLLDSIGSLFKITGGDEDSLLLDFYSSLRGPQGEQGIPGAAVSIDDSEESLSKTWSSSKIASELANAGGVPTLEITASQFVDENSFQLTQEQYDKIMATMCFNLILPNNGGSMFFIGKNNTVQANVNFFNFEDNTTVEPNEIGVYSISIVKATMVGTIDSNSYAKPKQLYQHNIKWLYYDSSNNRYDLNFIITNDSNVEFTDDTFFDWLVANGFDALGSKLLTPYGFFYTAIGSVYNGINSFGYIRSGSTDKYVISYYLGSTSSTIQINKGASNIHIKDVVIPVP